MRITHALLGEHGVFYAQFDHLEEILPAESRLECVRHHAALLAAALVSHAEMENDLLFGPLEAALGGGGGPPAAMREEHEEIESRLDEVGEEADLDQARNGLLEAIRLARSHFEKEERIAFPLAESVLGDRALQERGSEWADRRNVRIAEAL